MTGRASRCSPRSCSTAASDPKALRECLAQAGHEVCEADCDGDWWGWLAAHWSPSQVEDLRAELGRAETTLAWAGDHRELLRERDRADLARLEGLMRFDLSEQEMAPYLERRVCGIRGRYRLLGSQREAQCGLTQADIDAP